MMKNTKPITVTCQYKNDEYYHALVEIDAPFFIKISGLEALNAYKKGKLVDLVGSLIGQQVADMIKEDFDA